MTEGIAVEGGKTEETINRDRQQRMAAPLVLLLATATGLAVASIYYAQPLLEEMRAALGMTVAHAGLIVTASQLGYAAGLVLLVPLGDLLERRNLVSVMAFGIALGLAGIGFAPNAPVLLAASAALGAMSVVAQILVAFSADLAGAEERGRVVGTVMSGLLLGVLLARTAAGLIAHVAGWRVVFWLAASVMMVIAFAMYRGLPLRAPSARSGYLDLLRSIPQLFREEPVLRLRAVYGALAFAIFSVLWTPLAFLLSKPPFDYAPGVIGLFGLAGIAGAGAASAAGRLADRGLANLTTVAAMAIIVVSWIPVWMGRDNVWFLVVGIVLLDFGVQALHITNQSEIYRLRPEARSRLTSSYMSSFFVGGVVGSSLASVIYAEAGWTGVCILGAFLGCMAMVVRSVKRKG